MLRVNESADATELLRLSDHVIDESCLPGRLGAEELDDPPAWHSTNSESEILARSSFEETAKHLFNAALTGEMDTMRGVSANIMFGQKPPCGTGFVDILVDETKLPEGNEEDISVFAADLAAANARVDEEEKKEDSACRMEDVMMDW